MFSGGIFSVFNIIYNWAIKPVQPLEQAFTNFWNWLADFLFGWVFDISNFFDSVVSFFQMLGDYVSTLIENSFNFVQIIYSSMSMGGILSPLVFGVLGACISGVVSIAIIKTLLGR